MVKRGHLDVPVIGVAKAVDPALQAGTPVFEYEPQTWGPREDERVTPPGGLQDPVVSR